MQLHASGSWEEFSTERRCTDTHAQTCLLYSYPGLVFLLLFLLVFLSFFSLLTNILVPSVSPLLEFPCCFGFRSFFPGLSSALHNRFVNALPYCYLDPCVTGKRDTLFASHLSFLPSLFFFPFNGKTCWFSAYLSMISSSPCPHEIKSPSLSLCVTT